MAGKMVALNPKQLAALRIVDFHDQPIMQLAQRVQIAFIIAVFKAQIGHVEADIVVAFQVVDIALRPPERRFRHEEIYRGVTHAELIVINFR